MSGRIVALALMSTSNILFIMLLVGVSALAIALRLWFAKLDRETEAECSQNPSDHEVDLLIQLPPGSSIVHLSDALERIGDGRSEAWDHTSNRQTSDAIPKRDRSND